MLASEPGSALAGFGYVVLRPVSDESKHFGMCFRCRKLPRLENQQQGQNPDNVRWSAGAARETALS